MAALSCLALASLATPCAQGHAVILDAHPAMNAVLPPGDLDIRLEFNSRIDGSRSGLSLRGPGDRTSPVERIASERPNGLAGRARITLPGPWVLHWQVLSTDGHITRGDINFAVRGR